MRGAAAAGMVALIAGMASTAGFPNVNVIRSLQNSVSAGGPVQLAEAPKSTADRRTNRVMLGSGGTFGGAYYRRAGYGWTNMHQRRVARKARNVKRARKANRG